MSSDINLILPDRYEDLHQSAKELDLISGHILLVFPDGRWHEIRVAIEPASVKHGGAQFTLNSAVSDLVELLAKGESC